MTGTKANQNLHLHDVVVYEKHPIKSFSTHFRKYHMASIQDEQRWITDAPPIFFWGEGTAVHRLTLEGTTLNGERGWGRARGGEENLFYWKRHYGVRNVLNFLYFTRLSLTNIYYTMTMPRRNRKWSRWCEKSLNENLTYLEFERQ